MNTNDSLDHIEALEAALKEERAARAALEVELQNHRDDIWSLDEVQQALEAVSRSGSEFVIQMDQRIRTNLNGLLGMLKLLVSSDLAPEPFEFAKGAQASGRELLASMNNVLDYCRMDAGQIEIGATTFETAELLAGVVERAGPRAQAKGLELSCSIGEGVPERLLADLGHLELAAGHLIDNALAFTEQGSIRVGLELDRSEPEPSLVLSVVDTGRGIAPEDHARVCEAFERIDGPAESTTGEGLGLGLTVVRRLVELMGGRFELTSELSAGTRVSLGFELASIAASDMPATDQEGSLENESARVLVVEDDAINQRVAVGFLRMIGCEPEVAENGLQAIDRLSVEDFDLILMDCMMPELDGYGTTRHIREGQAGEGLRDIPIVALTADDSSTARHNCLRAGMDDFMTKPVRLDRLREILRSWLPAELRPPAD